MPSVPPTVAACDGFWVNKQSCSDADWPVLDTQVHKLDRPSQTTIQYKSNDHTKTNIIYKCKIRRYRG